MVVIRIIEYVEVCTGLLELDLQSYCRLCIYIRNILYIGLFELELQSYCRLCIYTQDIIYRIV